MIGRKSIVPMLNLAAGAVLGLIALKLTAIYFGPVFLGEVAYALAFFGILYVFSDLSMSDAHVKRVSEGEDVGDCFATFAVFRLASTALFVVMSAGSIWIYGYVLDKPFTDTTVPALVFALVYYVSKGLQSIAQSTFEARIEAARSQIISFVETVIRVALTILVAFVFAALAHQGGPLFGRIPADSAWGSWILANPAGALAATYAVGSFFGVIVAYAYLMAVLERGRFRMELLRSYFRFAIPLFFISAIGIMSLFIDRLALGFFGVAADTGEFEGPRRLVSVLEGIGGAVGLLLFPSISMMIARGDTTAVLSLVNRSVRYLSMMTLPIVAFLVTFPAPIIRLTLDDQWVGNSATLGLLAFWVYLTTISRPHLNLLMGSNQPGIAARIGITAAVVHISLNLLLIPDDIKSLGIDLPGLGSLGAALATVASGLLYYGLVVYATYRTNSYLPPLALLKHFVAAATMALALLVLHYGTPFELGRWYTFLIYVPLGGVTYLVSLIALRELTRDDWRYFSDTLHPGEMWRYLKSELLNKGDKS